MSSDSVGEIIGGFDEGGGIPVEDGTNRAGLAGGGTGAEAASSLWLSDLELGNAIFAIVGASKVGFITVMWFVYYLAGTTIDSYYWWTWFSSLVAIYVSWGPVVLSWILMMTGIEFAETWFFYTSLASISGPMVGYFVPIVILILAYNKRSDTGLIYTSKTHFWLGWWFAVSFTLLSIFFEITFLPGIRIWYDLKNNPELFAQTATVDEEEDGPIIIGEDTTLQPEDNGNTTFLAEFAHVFTF